MRLACKSRAFAAVQFFRHEICGRLAARKRAAGGEVSAALVNTASGCRIDIIHLPPPSVKRPGASFVVAQPPPHLFPTETPALLRYFQPTGC